MSSDTRIRRAIANTTKGEAARLTLPAWVRDLDLDAGAAGRGGDTAGTHVCGDLACATAARLLRDGPADVALIRGVPAGPPTPEDGSRPQ